MNTHKAVLTLLLSIICLSAAGPVAAQTTYAGDNPLDQIAWVVGGTWVAKSKAPDGSSVTIQFACKWASHKRLITYTIIKKYVDKTVPTIEGMIGWHPGKKQLVLWEMDNEGNLTESLLIVTGNNLSYNEVIYKKDGATLPVRAETIRQGEDAFVFKASVPKEGEWLEVFRADYQRVK